MKNYFKHSVAIFAGIIIAIAVGLLSFGGVSKSLYYLIEVPDNIIGTIFILILFVISTLISLFCGWSSYKQTNERLKK